MKKRILALLLAGSIMLLAACSGSSKDEDSAGVPVTEGRYVETEITPPGAGRFTSYLAADGTIVCYSEGLAIRYESTDGGASWSETPGPGAGTDRYQSIQAGTPLGDGRLLVYIMNEGLVLVSPDGSSQPYPFAAVDDAIANGESISVSLLQALGNDRLLLGYTSGGMVMQTRPDGEGTSDEADTEDEQTEEASVNAAGSGPVQVAGSGPVTSQRTQGGSRGDSFSVGSVANKTLLLELSTGNVTAELTTEYASAAASDDSAFYLMDMNGNVSAYNLSDGKPAGRADVSFSSTAGNQGGMVFGRGFNMGTAGGSTLALGSDGSLYALRDKSLVKAGPDGLISTVLESTAYSIGSPSGSISSVLVSNDGSIIVAMSSGQDSRLYRYVWDDNATVDPNKTLSIWSLEDNSFVRAAIAELRKQHPDSTITYEVATSGDNGVSASDAIKTLNTRLLGGSGPDIILLDGCPAESYADKGMLLDLTELIDTTGVYDKLLATYNADGQLYYLPTQFFIPALMGSANALSKAQTLDELVTLVVNGNVLPDGGAPGSNPFAGIPEEERAELYFNDLRELCKILWLSSAPAIVSDNKLNTDALREYLTAVRAISDKYGLMDTTGGEGPRMGMAVSVSGGGMAFEIPGSLIRYTSQMANYGAFAAGNLQILRMMMERTDSELVPFPGLASGAWQPSAVVGVSADTRVPEFAAEFVQTMLSTEIQQLNYGTGLPVTRAGMDAQIADINEMLAENDMGTFDIDIGALVDKLETPSVSDTVLTDMMWTTVEKCCRGELDVEGAVNEIERNVKNYLAERA